MGTPVTDTPQDDTPTLRKIEGHSEERFLGSDIFESQGRNLPPTFTPGFAAPEMHVMREVLGPWSDIYSIGATMYSCLAGAAPQTADTRLDTDYLLPANLAFADKYAPELLEIIDWCLQLDHLRRPQSVLALQKALLGEKPAHRPG